MRDYTEVEGDPVYSYDFFLRDHLGSTRMVINDEGSVTEAVMYQPYGSMTDLPGSATSALSAREKFTGKEFERAGEDVGRLEFDMTFDFDPDEIDLDPAKWNAIGIYYTDFSTPPEKTDADMVKLSIDDAANTATAKGIFTYSSPKQIKWVHILINYKDGAYDANCVVSPINENVGTGNYLKMARGVTTKTDIPNHPPTVDKNFFTYSRNGNYYFAGIGQYYFGARMYDPETGYWSGTDPAGQDWNPYGYCGGNPVIYVDPDGRVWFLPVLAAIGAAYLMKSTDNAVNKGMGWKGFDISNFDKWANDGVGITVDENGRPTTYQIDDRRYDFQPTTVEIKEEIRKEVDAINSFNEKTNRTSVSLTSPLMPSYSRPGNLKFRDLGFREGVGSSSGMTWDLAVSRGESYLKMHPTMNYETGDYACAPFANYVMTGKDFKYSQVEPMFGSKPLVNKVNPNGWYVVAWTHPDAASHVGVLHRGNVIHRADGFPMIMSFDRLNYRLTALGYDQISGYSPIYYNWGNR